MATVIVSIEVTIPDSTTGAEMVEAISEEYHYQPFLSDGETPNPVSRLQHIKNITVEGWRNAYIANRKKALLESGSAAIYLEGAEIGEAE